MIVFGRSQREVSKYVWTRQSLRHGYQLRTREVYHECRRFDEALPLLERAVLSQSLAIFAEVGDRYGRAAALHSLGRLRRAQRQPAEAVTHLRKAAAMYYELGSRRDESRALAELQLAQDCCRDAIDHCGR